MTATAARWFGDGNDFHRRRPDATGLETARQFDGDGGATEAQRLYFSHTSSLLFVVVLRRQNRLHGRQNSDWAVTNGMASTTTLLAAPQTATRTAAVATASPSSPSRTFLNNAWMTAAAPWNGGDGAARRDGSFSSAVASSQQRRPRRRSGTRLNGGVRRLPLLFYPFSLLSVCVIFTFREGKGWGAAEAKGS